MGTLGPWSFCTQTPGLRSGAVPHVKPPVTQWRGRWWRREHITVSRLAPLSYRLPTSCSRRGPHLASSLPLEQWGKLTIDGGSQTEHHLPPGIQERGMSPGVTKASGCFIYLLNPDRSLAEERDTRSLDRFQKAFFVQCALIMSGKGTACTPTWRRGPCALGA